MASIAYVGSTSIVGIRNTTASVSFNAGSSSNRYLLVQTSITDDSESVTAVTYGGQSLTLLKTLSYTNTGHSCDSRSQMIWGLANPASGSNTLSVTNTSTTYYAGALAVVYSGVNPTMPYTFSMNEGPANGTCLSGLGTSLVTSTNSWITLFASGKNNSSQSLEVSSGVTTKRVYKIDDSNAQPAMSILDTNGVATAGSNTVSTAWSSGTGGISVVGFEIAPYLQVNISGPSSGNVNSASTNFTVTPDVAINGTVTITPSGGGLTTPIVLTFSNSAVPQTFTITPTDSGTVTLTLSNAVGLYNASPITYTANAVVPTAPTIGTATPLNASASITFTDNSNGGSTITTHRAISTPGSFTGTSATSPITVTGLTNGVAYTFTVRATNAIGNSSESSASNSATPYVPASSFTFTGPSSGNVRSASTNFTVTPNSTYNGTITITPTGTGSTGLSPIVLTWALSSAAQTFTITPVTSGSITLTPTNSNSITNPANLTYTANAVVPLAPSIGLATPSISAAYVSFSAPSNDGGSGITLYTVTSTPGSISTTTDTPGTVQLVGLTNGTSYTFAVTATNSIGTSASSSASNAVIPTESSTSFTNSGPKFNITPGVGNLITF